MSATATGPDTPGPSRMARRLRRLGSSRIGWLALPAILYLAALYLLPLLYVGYNSFHSSEGLFANYTSAFSPSLPYIEVLGRTVAAAVIGSVLVAFVGYPVAYAIYLAPRRLKMILIVGVISPFLTSVLVRTFAWQVILGRLGPLPKLLNALGIENEGYLQTWFGLILGLMQITLPLFILPVVSVMAQVDSNAVRAARSLGAGPIQAFWRVFFPQTWPGVEVGLVLSFVSIGGAYVLPVVLGGSSATMLGVVINNNLNTLGDAGTASAMSVVLTVALFLGIAALRLATMRSRRWQAARQGASVQVRTPRVRRARLASVLVVADRLRLVGSGWVLAAFVLIVEAYLVVPQLIAIPVSFSGSQSLVFPPASYSTHWYREFATAKWLHPVGTSMIIAPISALIGTMLGGLAALGIERSNSRRLQAWAPPLILAPLAVPLVVVALGFFLLLDAVRLLDTIPGLILTQTTLVVPLAFVICRASVQSLDPAFERAGASMGARRHVVLRRIVFPLIRPAVLVSLLFTFLTVFDEVVVPIFVTSVNVNPLAKQLYDSVVFSSDPTIAVVGVFSIVMAALILGLALLLRDGRASVGGALAAISDLERADDSEGTS